MSHAQGFGEQEDGCLGGRLPLSSAWPGQSCSSASPHVCRRKCCLSAPAIRCPERRAWCEARQSAGLLDLPSADVVQGRRIAHHLLEMALQAEVDDEFFRRALLGDAEQLGRLAGADRAGEEDLGDAEGSIEGALDRDGRAPHAIGAPRGCLDGMRRIEAVVERLPDRPPGHAAQASTVMTIIGLSASVGRERSFAHARA